MKKLLIVGILIAVLLLTGCAIVTFNLCNWSCTNAGFNTLISTLNTPQKAIGWIHSYCAYYPHSISPYSPYQVYSLRRGQCADFSCFGMYAAHTHGYPTYEMIIHFVNETVTHSLGIYKVSGTYDYSSDRSYFNVNKYSFQQIADDYIRRYNSNLDYYVIEDYCNKVIKHVGVTSLSKDYPLD